MALLDGGIASIFGSVFGALYLDGKLVQSGTDPIYDGAGNIIGYEGGVDVDIKCQVDGVTWAMQQAPGYVEGDCRIIILRAGLGVDVTTDHRVEVGGKTWLIQSVETDAAGSHWICRGRLA